jgi:hypothetical protein
MLRGVTPEELVEFHSLVRSNTLLILWAVLPQPKVNISNERAIFLARLEDDVWISIKEAACVARVISCLQLDAKRLLLHLRVHARFDWPTVNLSPVGPLDFKVRI